jgi:hypothetical protein
VRFNLAIRGLALGGVALAVCAVAGVQTASAAPRSGSPDGPRPTKVATTGDCELASVTCRPPLPGSLRRPIPSRRDLLNGNRRYHR